MKLPKCYVLIESLDVPVTKYYKDVTDDISETLASLNLDNDDSGASDMEEDVEEDLDEQSDFEESLVPKRVQNVNIKDKAMEKSLSDVLRTKII
jgi:hypothetical protein